MCQDALQHRRPAGYHVDGLHAYIWATQPLALAGPGQQLPPGLRDSADVVSRNARLDIFNNRCSIFCYERGVELDTAWAKDVLSVAVRGGSVSLVPTPCSAESVDDHGETVVRKLLSGVVMKRPAHRPVVRTWAAIRLVCDSDGTAQELWTALEALRIRHMQTIPKRLAAENGELEKAMVLQHQARSLLAKLGVRPEGVLSLAAVSGAANGSPRRQPSSYLQEVEEIVDEDEDDEAQREDDEDLFQLGISASAASTEFLPFGPVVQSLLSRSSSATDRSAAGGPAAVQRSTVGAADAPPARQPWEHGSSHQLYSSPASIPGGGVPGGFQQGLPVSSSSPPGSFSPTPAAVQLLPPVRIARYQQPGMSSGSGLAPSVSLSAASVTSILADQTAINVADVEEIFPSPRDDSSHNPAAAASHAGHRKAAAAVFASRRPVSPDDDGDDALSEVSLEDGAEATGGRVPSGRRARRTSLERQYQAAPEVRPSELVEPGAAAPRDTTTPVSPRAGSTATPVDEESRPRLCRWCQRPAPPQHDAKCKQRLVRCRRCGEPSLLGDIKQHVCKAA
jgi:hypothetical protein